MKHFSGMNQDICLFFVQRDIVVLKTGKGLGKTIPTKLKAHYCLKYVALRFPLNGTNHEKESESDRFVKRHLEIQKIRLH